MGIIKRQWHVTWAFLEFRVPTVTGKPGNPGKWKWSLKSHGTWKIGKKSWKLVISHRMLPILLLNLTQFAPFFADIKNSSISLKSLNFSTFFFPQKCRDRNILAEMVLDNWETVMEKSWKILLQSMWEPYFDGVLPTCMVLTMKEGPRNITGRPGVSIMWLGGLACRPMTCYPSEAAL